MHKEQFNKFDCSKERYSDGLNQCLRNSLKRGVTTLVFFDESNERKLIAYCAYRCSSLKFRKTQYPAVEIVNFAVDKNYQDICFDDENQLPYSAFILQLCVDIIKKLCRETIWARYIVLQAEKRSTVLNFYEKNLFTTCDANYKMLGQFNDYLMFREILRCEEDDEDEK